MKIKKLKLAIILLIILLIALAIVLVITKDKTELKSIKSKKELEKIYYGKNTNDYNFEDSLFLKVIAMPFTYFEYGPRYRSHYYYDDYYWDMDIDYMPRINSITTIGPTAIAADTAAPSSKTSSLNTLNFSKNNSKDYSTTNIQVENVDEADITKTDGDFIYSLSENNVIITDVRDPKNIKIASKINMYGNAPEDLLLYNNKLVVIYADNSSIRGYYGNTVVVIYDITDKTNPKSLKSYTLFEPYYTCRCIDNNLYVISSGMLRMENNEVSTDYIEDSNSKEIPLKNIYYLTTVDSNIQTLISKVDLNNAENDISINSYLIDISNAYVSENAIYLLNYTYNDNYTYNGNPPISSLFTLKGAFGPFTYEEDDDSGYYTEIYKFNILDDGSIKYSNKAKTKGQTINQYSLDEFEGNLRVALYDENGSKVVIYDKNMKLIGESTYVAKGEKMYSSRFIGNKVYFVTFKNMDPLFVMDLSNPKKPKVLGELKIPGYSTYLHPYDENHIIGIGMETEEIVYRNNNGKVISNSSRITGMKMALFDVSDVSHPRELSKTVIGDSRTTSAILTNPKALLFSKEKELIAIPVNNYANDFSISYSDNTESVVNSYTNYNYNYISEGYMVYKINLDEGFKLKGIITHENNKNSNYYYSNSRLLRGLYIDENLYTISETKIKVNNLDDLKQVSELEIIKPITQNNNEKNNGVIIDSKNIIVD